MSEASEPLPETTCDILVAGGGPAGSTVAALLAERGYSVTLLEKDKHPRFHIGESLLPMNLPLFEKLGVKEDVARIGMFKPGAEFIAAHDDRKADFQFSQALNTEIGYAYQVRRSDFDHILLKKAVSTGAKVIEQCKVTDVDFPASGGVVAKSIDDNGQHQVWSARFFVDASGRDTLLAKKFGIKRRNRDHNTAALYTHFRGARRLEGASEGIISVFFFDHGWFWFIPLSDGVTSVGAVCHPDYIKTRKGDLTRFFNDTVALAPALAERLNGAHMEMAPIGTGNYVYRADRMGGDRYILLGDSFAFIDPMFSTGVYMAMTGAFRGADVIETCLRDPKKGARAMKRFEKIMVRGADIFCWYIYRITTPALSNLFLVPRNYFRMEEAILSILAGNVFRRTGAALPLFIFKCIYYVNSALTFRKSLTARRMRRRAVAAGLNEAG